MTAHIRPREFPLSRRDRLGRGAPNDARVDGKQPLCIATPPEFKGRHPDLRSPEDAFVAPPRRAWP